MPKRKFRELVQAMLPERQQRIANRVRQSLAATPLDEIRNAREMTQAKLAETLEQIRVRSRRLSIQRISTSAPLPDIGKLESWILEIRLSSLIAKCGLSIRRAAVSTNWRRQEAVCVQLRARRTLPRRRGRPSNLGRIAFNSHGGLSGTASATFRGFLLGNPVTGSYEAKSNCSVIWKLQDDSGGFQNFSGTLSGDGTSVQFKQTDPGGAQHGIMQKMSDACSAADLQKKYYFTVSGSTTPMQLGDAPRVVSARGTLDVAENGSFRVESDCSVGFQLTLPAQDGQVVKTPLMTMRGFLVSGGKEILAFQTDPGAMVAARLTSDGR
jgi:hypothetical protein